MVISVIGIAFVLLLLLSLYVPAYLQCSEGLQWDMSCSFHDDVSASDKFLIHKATSVFQVTLDKYQIDSSHLSVHKGARWGSAPEKFFMAESVAHDGSRYFLKTLFAEDDASIDKIDVQVFKITSDKCTYEHMVYVNGCELEYLQELKIPVPPLPPPSGVDFLLMQNNIDYVSENLVISGGWGFYGDPGCGVVIDTDSQTHWFAIDSVSDPREMTMYSENPHPCKVNTSSCFCSAQMDLTVLTLDELSYFTKDEEEKYANILLDYIKNNAGMKNIEPKFRIGKLNLNFTDSSAVGYCGERPGNNTSNFFSGAIVNGYVKDYGLDERLSLLCALSNDARWWERR